MRRVAVFLFVFILVAGVAEVSANHVQLTVLTPGLRVYHGARMLAHFRAPPPTTVSHLVVVLPVMIDQTPPACVDIQIMRVLARMTEVESAFHADLSTGASFLCQGTFGTLDRWPSGGRAMALTNAWYYPNGARASGSPVSWYYPNGETARSATATWHYPNGKTARRRDGTWYTPEGVRIGQIHAPTSDLVTAGMVEQLWAVHGGGS